MHIRSLFLLALSLTSLCSSAQDNWDMYMVQLDNKPASILVDLNVINFAPDPRYPYLVITGPRTDKCSDDGIPIKEEIEKMEDVLSASGSFITGLTPKTLVGTVTHHCGRMNYYYVKDTTGIRTAIHRMYIRSFRNYNYSLDMRKEPDWRTYRTFLYPNEENRNWMENTRIISNLVQQGDSLQIPRIVKFALLFKTDSNRQEFTKYIGHDGFATDRQFLSQINTTIPYGIIISKTMPVIMDSVTKVTNELRTEASLQNGKLDSWDVQPAHQGLH